MKPDKLITFREKRLIYRNSGPEAGPERATAPQTEAEVTQAQVDIARREHQAKHAKTEDELNRHQDSVKPHEVEIAKEYIGKFAKLDTPAKLQKRCRNLELKEKLGEYTQALIKLDSLLDTLTTEHTLESPETEKVEIPKPFLRINKQLKLSPDALQNYYKAYLKIPENKRIPLREIENVLGLLARTVNFAEKKAGETLFFQNLLVEIFGHLINGNKRELMKIRKVIDNKAFEQIILRSNKESELQAKKIEEIRKKHQELKGRLEKRLDNLGKLVEKHGEHFFQQDPDIAKILEEIQEIDGIEKKIDTVSQQLIIETLKLVDIQGKIAVNQYKILKNLGVNTDRFLLDASDQFGNKVPDELEENIEVAKKKLLANPKTSEFEHYYYQGKYKEALQVLRKTESQLPGWGAFNIHDLVKLYESAKNKPKKQFTNFPDGSFAAQKLKEGYICPVIPGRKDKILIKREDDDSLHLLNTTNSGYAPPRSTRKFFERSFSIKEQEEAAEQKTVLRKNVMRVISQNPHFEKARKAATEIQEKFLPLRQLFQAGIEGGKTIDFVEKAKKYAKELKKSPAIKELAENAKAASDQLSALEDFAEARYKDEFEKEIDILEKSLTQAVDLASSNVIENFCNQIIDSSFDEDTFKNWFIKEGIPMIASIAVAVGAIIVTTGTGGVGGLLIAAGAGSFGGMVGYEAGTTVSQWAGEQAYGDLYSQNKTALQKYVTGEKIDGKEMSLSDLGEIYGKQFVIGFVTTFTLMGLGRLIGPALSKFAAANKGSAKICKRFAAKFIDKLPKMNQQRINLLNKKGFGRFMNKLGKEFLQEIGEEGVEDVSKRIHPLLGFVASVYNCLDGRKVEYSLGKFKVVAESNKKIESGTSIEIESIFSFDAAQTTEIQAELKRNYKEGSILVEEDGRIIVRQEMTLKNGMKTVNTMVFSPTSENLAMRQLFGEGRLEKSNKSPIERLYGVTRTTEDNVYEFKQFSPKGKINLAKYLKKEGFIISSELENGKFEAQHGETVLQFRDAVSQERVSTETLAKEVKTTKQARAQAVTSKQLEQKVHKIDQINRKNKANVVERLTDRLTPKERLMFREAYLDPMTGMLNREGLKLLDNMIAEGEKISLLSYDGDHFKAFNEVKDTQYGENMKGKHGDYMIKVMGAEFHRMVQELHSKGFEAEAVRMGGEEFVVFSNAPKTTLKQVMEQSSRRIKKAVREHLTPKEMKEMALDIAKNKYADLKDSSGKNIGYERALSEIGGSTAGIIEFQIKPGADSAKVRENALLIADHLLEYGKSVKGRGNVYLDRRNIQSTSESILKFKAENSLSNEFNTHLQNIDFSLKKAVSRQFMERIPLAQKLLSVHPVLEQFFKSPTFSKKRLRKLAKELNITENELLEAKQQYIETVRDFATYTGAATMNYLNRMVTTEGSGFKKIRTMEPMEFKSINETMGHTYGDTFLTNAYQKVIRRTILDLGLEGKVIVAQERANFKFSIHESVSAADRAKFERAIIKNYESGVKKLFEKIDYGNAQPVQDIQKTWLEGNKSPTTMKESLENRGRMKIY